MSSAGKVLATKPEGLSSILGTHMVTGNPICPLTSLCEARLIKTQ